MLEGGTVEGRGQGGRAGSGAVECELCYAVTDGVGEACAGICGAVLGVNRCFEVEYDFERGV